MNQQGAMMLKVGLGIVAVCLGGYIVGPPLYWHFMEAVAASSPSSSSSSCAPCVCDCSSQPLLHIPHGLSLSQIYFSIAFFFFYFVFSSFWLSNCNLSTLIMLQLPCQCLLIVIMCLNCHVTFESLLMYWFTIYLRILCCFHLNLS